jgi:hypothetical protein
VSAAPSGMMAGAPAPGPMAGKPMADIHFTITASRAVLAANTLTLSGVAPVALYTTAAQGVGMTTVSARLPGLYYYAAGCWSCTDHITEGCLCNEHLQEVTEYLRCCA